MWHFPQAPSPHSWEVFANCLMATLRIWFSTYAKVRHCFHLLNKRIHWGCISNCSGTLHLIWGNFSPLCSRGVEIRATISCLFLDPEFQQAVVLISALFLVHKAVYLAFLSPAMVFFYLLLFIYHYSVFSVKVGPAQLGCQARFSLFNWHVHMRAHL